MTTKQINFIFYILLILNSLFLSYISTTFSISIKDSEIFYSTQHNILWYLIHFSTTILGQTTFALRLPFIIFYILSVLLLYILTDSYFRKPIDRLISIVIFMVLPGLISASILINSSIIVVFSILLYLYLYKLNLKLSYILLVLYLFIDNSFMILYLSLFFYAISKKDRLLAIVSFLLFFISNYMYQFAIDGRPEGYFLDTFAIYISIFSPILGLYFFYILYRVATKGQKDIFWYIASTSLLVSLVLSLRQRIDISDFAPYVVIAIPLMVKVFMYSYRVRLKEFRYKHKLFVKIMLLVLGINTIILLFNKPIYFILDNPLKHFSHKFHISEQLSKKLKEQNIFGVICEDDNLQKQLKFYNVTKSSNYILTNKKVDDYYKKIDIKYGKKVIATYYILLRK